MSRQVSTLKNKELIIGGSPFCKVMTYFEVSGKQRFALSPILYMWDHYSKSKPLKLIGSALELSVQNWPIPADTEGMLSFEIFFFFF